MARRYWGKGKRAAHAPLEECRKVPPLNQTQISSKVLAGRSVVWDVPAFNDEGAPVVVMAELQAMRMQKTGSEKTLFWQIHGVYVSDFEKLAARAESRAKLEGRAAARGFLQMIWNKQVHGKLGADKVVEEARKMINWIPAKNEKIKQFFDTNSISHSDFAWSVSTNDGEKGANLQTIEPQATPTSKL